MEAIRQVYEQLPAQIAVPAPLRRRRVEVIMLPLDDQTKTPLPACGALHFAPVKVKKIEMPSREERNARR